MRIRSFIGFRVLLPLAAMAILAGCAGSLMYQSTAILADLQIRFADPRWNGRQIPAGEQCARDGGHGATPALVISNIPPKANALVFEYSDRSLVRMDDGGHGVIGYRFAPGRTSVRVPAVPGNTFDLPAPFFVVSAHRNPFRNPPGAYLPPCSGARGHLYTLNVEALYMPDSLDAIPQLLGQGKIRLGRY